MKLAIRHDTTYRYDDQVRASIQYLRLTPQESQRQHVSTGISNYRAQYRRSGIPMATSCMC